MIVTLCEDGVPRQYVASVVICRVFNGEPPTPEHQAAHDNGEPWDNRPENLIWKTRSENMADCVRHGTDNRGEKHCFAKLTAAAVQEIRRRRRSREVLTSIAADYGVTAATICDIMKGRSWAHLPEESNP
jgi:HNH endonuclease